MGACKNVEKNIWVLMFDVAMQCWDRMVDVLESTVPCCKDATPCENRVKSAISLFGICLADGMYETEMDAKMAEGICKLGCVCLEL